MLSATWTLWDCEDVEAVVARAADRYQRKHSSRLNHSDLEELTCYLFMKAYEMSLRFRPGPGASFTRMLEYQLPLRAVDWGRSGDGRKRWQFAGRTAERDIQKPSSLDLLVGATGEPAAPTDGHPAADRDPDFLARILGAPGSSEAWDETGGSEAGPRRAA